MAFSFYIDKLSKLSVDTKPVWGKMSSQHMVEHLIQSVQLSNGKMALSECMTPDERLPLMKKILMSKRPLPKNFVNTVIGAELKPLIYPDLKASIEALKKELQSIDKFFDEKPDSKPMNPTFGPLNKEEWNQFHNKHFKHHFAQFGLLEE